MISMLYKSVLETSQASAMKFVEFPLIEIWCNDLKEESKKNNMGYDWMFRNIFF